MRQKVVSVLIFLGVVFSIFRCSGGEKDENIQEVAVATESEVGHQEQAEIATLSGEEAEKVDVQHAEEMVEHVVVHEAEVSDTTVVNVEEAVKPSHEKTLFFKSDEFIQTQKVETERMAALAVVAEAKDAVHAKARAEAAKEKARLENELVAKLESDKVATIKAEADKKLHKDRETLRLSEENAKMKSSQEALLEKIKEWEVKATTSQEESLKIKADAEEKLLAKIKEWEVKATTSQEESLKIKVADEEKLLAKIKEWEVKATASQAESKKLKVAAVAAAALATQQAVANVQSEGTDAVAKLQSTLDEVSQEKKTLEIQNAKMEYSQGALLEKIKEWEVKAVAAKEESLKLKEETVLAAEQALASAKSEGSEVAEKLESALAKVTEEKAALQAEIEASTQVNVDMNSSINTTKAALLTKIEEWEQKALQAESQEKIAYAETVEKYKTVLANLTQEKVLLEETNTKMKSSQEALLEKIGVWEVRVTEAEAESGKLKVAAVAAATLATQQAVANAQSIGEEEAAKFKGELEQLIEEKNSLLQANAEMNSSMHASKEELLAKIAQWETKATAAEAESAKATAELTEEKSRLLQVNTDMNSSMHASKEELLAKLAQWEAKATAAEAESAKATAELTEEKSRLLQANTDMNSSMHATQEGLLAKLKEWEAKATSAEAEASQATVALTEEKNRLLQINADMNSSMHASKEELLAKLAQWETKASESEENSNKLKAAAVAAALVATQQATADKEVATEVEMKLKEAEAALEKMKADAASIAEEKARVEAAVAAKEQAEKEETARVAQAKEVAKSAANEKLANLLASSQIEFKYNSSQLTKKSEALLDSIVEIINENSTSSYDIQGHTDAHGNEDYNIKLSTSRAGKVKAYLVEKGINKDTLVAKGFGSSVPIADNSTNEGRLKNRRVMIKIAE